MNFLCIRLVSNLTFLPRRKSTSLVFTSVLLLWSAICHGYEKINESGTTTCEQDLILSSEIMQKNADVLEDWLTSNYATDGALMGGGMGLLGGKKLEQIATRRSLLRNMRADRTNLIKAFRNGEAFELPERYHKYLDSNQTATEAIRRHRDDVLSRKFTKGPRLMMMTTGSMVGSFIGQNGDRFLFYDKCSLPGVTFDPHEANELMKLVDVSIRNGCIPVSNFIDQIRGREKEVCSKAPHAGMLAFKFAEQQVEQVNRERLKEIPRVQCDDQTGSIAQLEIEHLDGSRSELKMMNGKIMASYIGVNQRFTWASAYLATGLLSQEQVDIFSEDFPNQRRNNTPKSLQNLYASNRLYGTPFNQQSEGTKKLLIIGEALSWYESLTSWSICSGTLAE